MPSFFCSGRCELGSFLSEFETALQLVFICTEGHLILIKYDKSTWTSLVREQRKQIHGCVLLMLKKMRVTYICTLCFFYFSWRRDLGVWVSPVATVVWNNLESMDKTKYTTLGHSIMGEPSKRRNISGISAELHGGEEIGTLKVWLTINSGWGNSTCCYTIITQPALASRANSDIRSCRSAISRTP